MKLHRLLILSGLLLTVAPAASFAACSPACAEGVACRITSQGPPTVYQCASGIRAGRAPTGPLATKSGVAQTGSAPNGPAALTTGPKNTPNTNSITYQKIESVKSPRDVASGQATGKREPKP